MIYFSSNIGGGVFGEGQVSSWRSIGLPAELHYQVQLNDYWRAKSGGLDKLLLRYRMYVQYPLRLCSFVHNSSGDDIIVSVTNPFFAPALASRAAKQSKAKVVNLIYDLYPEALCFGGGFSSTGIFAKFAAWSTRNAIENCDATVYLGEYLKSYAEKEHGVCKVSCVIPVGTDTKVFENHEPQCRETEIVRCIYSGHMGRLHDWETLACALSAGAPSGVSFEFASDGPSCNQLKEYLERASPAGNGNTIIFSKTRGTEDWKNSMLSSDVAFVTMRQGAEKVVMPSKTYSAMAAGQAVLAICPKCSDLADTVLKHDCGWVIEPGQSEELRALLSSLPNRRDEILVKRRNAYQAAHTYYSMEATAKQWVALFNSL